MTNWTVVSTLLAGIPELPGARCKGAAGLYEATVNERTKPTNRAELERARTAALNVCADCPALDACRAWLDQQQPTRRPRGVVAGRVITATGHLAKSLRVNQ
ncbi:hypothetical protein MTIM_40110 [Mycobacterium timonense]|jgi:hypothetical protein|uniref:4Fe-4S Wbl-type domain-containing protein n=1 Tax=Mycobacterium timonense TaxID=701043 RepID=A0A7I9ZBB2_9MYCO|nr:hypothetical protein MTIM_40110 [Mycobacterium timonense]